MLDGVMIEPSVSVPSAKPTRPAAVAAPGPADDPLEPVSAHPWIARRAAEPHAALRQRSHRQLGDQHCAGVRAGARRPSRRDRAPESLYGFAPQVVWMPLVAKRSFAPHGMPCSGPRYLPAFQLRGPPWRPARARDPRSASRRSAAARRSASRRSRYILVRSVDVIRRLSMSDDEHGDRLETRFVEAGCDSHGVVPAGDRAAAHSGVALAASAVCLVGTAGRSSPARCRAGCRACAAARSCRDCG